MAEFLDLGKKCSYYNVEIETVEKLETIFLLRAISIVFRL